MNKLYLWVRIKYYYRKLRGITCKDCMFYFKLDDDFECDYYGILDDLSICRADFISKSKLRKY